MVAVHSPVREPKDAVRHPDRAGLVFDRKCSVSPVVHMPASAIAFGIPIGVPAEPQSMQKVAAVLQEFESPDCWIAETEEEGTSTSEPEMESPAPSQTASIRRKKEAARHRHRRGWRGRLAIVLGGAAVATSPGPGFLDLETGKHTALDFHEWLSYRLAANSNGSQVVYAYRGGQVRIIDARTHVVRQQFSTGIFEPYDAHFNRNGSRVAICGRDTPGSDKAFSRQGPKVVQPRSNGDSVASYRCLDHRSIDLTLEQRWLREYEFTPETSPYYVEFQAGACLAIILEILGGEGDDKQG